MHRLFMLVLVAGLATLATAACGSDSDDDATSGTVRPITEILVGEIVVTDLSATGAVIEVETSIDVACAVVFGTDTGYGRLSTDPDMGGAAHSDHFAPLRGLEPDTVYHYRLQGSGPDGALYVSDDLTFRTPPADADAAPTGINLAGIDAGAQVIEVSSVFSDSPDWAAERAIDGDPATEWSSDGDGNDAYITIQLAEPAHIGTIAIWTRTMGSSAEIQQFQVVTDDGTVLGPFDVSGAAQMHTYEVDVTAETLRIEVLESSGGNTGLVEFGAFAAE